MKNLERRVEIYIEFIEVKNNLIRRNYVRTESFLSNKIDYDENECVINIVNRLWVKRSRNSSKKSEVAVDYFGGI
jgi:hypothetical protein